MNRRVKVIVNDLITDRLDIDAYILLVLDPWKEKLYRIH